MAQKGHEIAPGFRHPTPGNSVSQGRIRPLKEMDEVRLLSNVPKIQWASNPKRPYVY